MKIDNLYHSTSQVNLLDILRSKKLFSGEGERIGGLDSDYIYLSDLYHKYLSVIFGSVIISFKAKNLTSKNDIRPTIYDESDKDNFLDMPFEEAEWSSKEVAFNYNDIEKIIFVVSNTSDGGVAGVIRGIMEREGIKIDLVEEEKMPDHSYEFCLKRYYERVESYVV